MLLGCIGDDFTGSSDIGNALAKAGMRVTQYNGVPQGRARRDVEAGIVSLKTRSIAVDDAVAQSLAAASWLLEQGCKQLYFKYCSTFDSTPKGNIGPVAEALANLVDEDKVIICPAFPAAGRTVYQGNLFVGDQPLSESGMRDHPITPMTDSDIRRWLSHQTSWNVEHLGLEEITGSEGALADRIDGFGKAMIVADIVEEANFEPLARALSSRKLVTGGSGLAAALPQNFVSEGKRSDAAPWAGVDGEAAILCGSCSTMSRAQIAAFSGKAPSLAIDAFGIAKGELPVRLVADWIYEQKAAPLVYSSMEPEEVERTQSELGAEKSAELIEKFFGQLAVELRHRGMRKIVCAGGETSGAIVTALGVRAMMIGPEIAAGVPALKVEESDLALVLKSGNFGGEDFFQDALTVLSNGQEQPPRQG